MQNILITIVVVIFVKKNKSFLKKKIITKIVFHPICILIIF